MICQNRPSVFFSKKFQKFPKFNKNFQSHETWAEWPIAHMNLILSCTTLQELSIEIWFVKIARLYFFQKNLKNFHSSTKNFKVTKLELSDQKHISILYHRVELFKSFRLRYDLSKSPVSIFFKKISKIFKVQQKISKSCKLKKLTNRTYESYIIVQNTSRALDWDIIY